MTSTGPVGSGIRMRITGLRAPWAVLALVLSLPQNALLTDRIDRVLA